MPIQNSIELIEKKSNFAIKMEKYDPFCIEKIKKMNGSIYDWQNQCWSTNLDNKHELENLFSNKLYSFIVTKAYDTSE